MAKRPSLPSVTSDIPRDLRTFIDRLREAITGDTFVTVADYIAGSVPGSSGGGGTGGSGTTLPCGAPASPSAPTGLTVGAGLSGFLLSWDQAVYCGHAFTEVWGLRDNDLGAAIKLGTSAGRMYSHAADEAGAYWCFWVRHVNILGQAGPYNQTGGVCATTALDPDYLISLLAGKVTQSTLYSTLSSRIDLIDGTGPGSVTARIASSVAALQSEVDTLTGAAAFASTNTYAVGTAVSYDGKLYRCKLAITTTPAPVPTNTTYWDLIGEYSSLSGAVAAHAIELADHETRITNTAGTVTALSSTVTALSSTVSTNATTAASLVASEASTRSTNDTALSTTLSALTATVNTNATTASSAVASEATARANADGAISTTLSGLTSTVNTNASNATAAVAAEASTRATNDTAIATTVSTLATTVSNNASSAAAAIASEASTRADAISAASTAISTVSARVNRVTNVHIRAIGGGGAQALITAEDGTTLVTGTRSYTLAVFNGSTGALVSSQSYDVWQYAAQATALATALNALGSDKVAVVVTSDEPLTNRLLNGLPAALYRCGASSLVFGSSAFADHSAYILVGIPGSGEGAGVERYGTSTAEYQLQMVSGRPVALGGNPLSAAVQTEASARVAADGALQAQYTVKVDVAGFVSGFGLASTAAVNETPSSLFGVRADHFFIAGPSYSNETAPTTNNYKGRAWYKPSTQVTSYYTGSGWSTSNTYAIVPFQVISTPTPIDGTMISPGTYIDGAYVRTASIDWATIKTATIDYATITSQLIANHIMARNIGVDEYINSSNYVSGSTGWRISGTGTAEFSNVVVRGTVYATDGWFKGMLYGGAATSYTSGTGLFSGLDAGTYKMRVGAAGGSRIEWTGARLDIYNSANKLILSSGDGLAASASTNFLSAAYFDYTSYWSLNNSNAGSFIAGQRPQSDTWSLSEPYPGRTLAIWGNLGTVNYNGRYADFYQTVFATPGQRYQFYVYSGAHRGTASCYLVFMDDVGTWLGFYDDNGAYNSSVPMYNNIEEASGGQQLSGYKLLGGFATAPAGTTRVQFTLRLTGKNATVDTPYAFFVRPFLSIAGATQQTLTAWSPLLDATKYPLKTEVTTYVDNLAAEKITTGILNAERIGANSIAANRIIAKSIFTDRLAGASVSTVTSFAVQSGSSMVYNITDVTSLRSGYRAPDVWVWCGGGGDDYSEGMYILIEVRNENYYNTSVAVACNMNGSSENVIMLSGATAVDPNGFSPIPLDPRYGRYFTTYSVSGTFTVSYTGTLIGSLPVRFVATQPGTYISGFIILRKR